MQTEFALDRLQPHAQASRGGLASWQMLKLSQYIEDNLASKIHTDCLRRIVRLSHSHFSRAFKRSFGLPPHAYVMHRRIRRAEELMLGTEHSLCQIALECGLCDQAHLSTVFRRTVGSSPGTWRRQLLRSAHMGAQLRLRLGHSNESHLGNALSRL